jgi:Na+-driven multidrug efflux pump
VTDLLLVASLTALILLNALDSVITQMAVNRGHPELNRLARFLIEKYGLDRGMLYKALLGIPIASAIAVVVIIMNILGIPGIALAATIASLIGVVFFSFVLLFNCRQLIRGQKAKG